jgi:mannose-6-phosphate isomerase
MPDTPLYPLKFAPVYKEKVWGGRTLEANLGRDLPGDTDTLVGESWELVDLGTTSVSGGGGGAERSTVTNGALAGQTLAQIIQHYGNDLLADLPLSDDGGFPILLKYLDANQNLSVQVHPSPEYAAEHDDAFLKSESWYIVAAAPGSVIYKGIKEGVTPEQLRAAIETNTDEAVVPLMIEVPVKPGDCHYVPSGTCHALGAGILVAEVQTPSDTTYRVYDFERVDPATGQKRQLHVEQALQCINFDDPNPPEPVTTPGDGVAIVEAPQFTVFRRECGDSLDLAEGFAVLVCIDGEAALNGEDFRRGDTVILPHDRPAARVTGQCTFLETRLP